MIFLSTNVIYTFITCCAKVCIVQKEVHTFLMIVFYVFGQNYFHIWFSQCFSGIVGYFSNQGPDVIKSMFCLRVHCLEEEEDSLLTLNLGQ